MWIIKQLFTKVKADKVEYKHMDHFGIMKIFIFMKLKIRRDG